MEFEEASNSSNVTYYLWEYSAEHQMIFALLSIIGIIADVLIIYCIFHFKQLQTVANIFLANWALADLLSLLITPSAYRIVSFVHHLPLPGEFYCILGDSGTILHGAAILFVILVTTDWIISAYFRQASDTFRRPYRYIIGAIWTATSLLIFTSIIQCCVYDFNMEHPLFLQLFAILVLAMALLVFGIQIMRLVQKLRKRPSDISSLHINLVTAFVGCWILSILSFIFSQNLFYHPILELITNCLVFSSSTINFGLLYCYNKDFHACIKDALRCFGRQRKRSEDENNTVSVLFNKPSSKLTECDFSKIDKTP